MTVIDPRGGAREWFWRRCLRFFAGARAAAAAFGSGGAPSGEMDARRTLDDMWECMIRSHKRAHMLARGEKKKHTGQHGWAV